MGIPYNKYIQLLRESKKKRRQLACLVTALSVFVSGGVFWQLRGIGTAMVDENLPTADDSGCDLTATPLGASELETQDVWEATLPTLTDIAGENLARIAESQLGYSESSINFVHAEDGETHNGYTRYGAWYGNPYGDWNTMFTYFCMNYAGIGSDDIPYGSGCWAWSLELDKGGLVVPVTRGSPARGDILLIDSDLDGKADRSCIVTAVSDDDIPEISAIEGDVDGEVAATAYLLDDEHLLGMVSLADIVPEPPVLPEEPAYVDFTAESESGIRVEAHADSFAFPSDTEMFVFDISRDDAIQTAAAHFGDADSDTIEAVAVDITFMTPDGSELEPAEGSLVSVNISLPEEQSLTGCEFSLLHVSDGGDVQEVADASVSADGAEFVAESFSVYVVTSNGTAREKKSLILSNGLRTTVISGAEGTYSNQNNKNNPYVIGVGESVEIWYEGEDYRDCWFTVSGNDYASNTIHRIVRADSFTVGDESPNWYHQDRFDNNMLKAKFVGNTASLDTDYETGLYIVVKKHNDENNEDVEVDKLYLRVVDNPVYMYLGEERLILDTALQNLNGNSNTMFLLEGESVTLSVNGNNDGNAFISNDTSIVSKVSVSPNANQTTDITFTAGNKHGSTIINANGHEITVNVVHPIYVKDSFGERDIDRINEWLYHFAAGAKINGYHPNSSNEPYRLHNGDILKLRIPANDLAGANLEISDTSVLEIVNGSLTPDSNGNINVELRAHNSSESTPINTTVVLKNGNDVQRTMYIHIRPTHEDPLDHADIEIADGGKYTVTKLKRGVDGSITKIVTTYRAYVSGVNSSTLYSSINNDTKCKFYESGEWTESDGESIWNPGYWGPDLKELDSVSGYEKDNYYVDPGVIPGAPQYEFTSKYRPHYVSDGITYDWCNNRKFYAFDVDHAVFDVELTLEPESEVSQTLQADNTWSNPVPTNNTLITITKPNVEFYMDHQAVIDAYNKCPNHSGLDFTIMAFSALVEFDLEKKLTGADQLTDGQFKFGLFKNEDDTEPISTVTNNADGIVTFDTLHFEKPGSYTYYVKEIVDTPAADIIYDNKTMTLQIQVTENPTTNQLTANILTNVDDFKFINHKTYTLPSTGGTGELPYIIFGGTMLAGAFTLLYIRRKKVAAR